MNNKSLAIMFLRTLLLVLLLTQLVSIQLIAQEKPNNDSAFHKNMIKINLIPIASSINGHNQKRIGIEYERFLNQKLSLYCPLDFGLYNDYTFIKYYDFFDEEEGFAYRQQEVSTLGYHIMPSIKYYFYNSRKKYGQGFYIAGNIDFNQYFTDDDVFYSLSGTYNHEDYSTTRLAIGCTLGGQFIAFSRLVIDLNISIFTTLISSNQGMETKPLHASWVFNNNNSWSTVNFSLGYAFGGGKK